MFGVGVYELLIVLAIVLLFFGGSRIPSVMRSLGSSVSEFKKGLNDPGEDEASKTQEKLN
ncbi:MAG: twin-arginine translocase TatA/TatE family subunit [Planctomycetales bacterium]